MSKTVGNATGQGQDYTVATGTGVVDADTQRVVLANDQPVVPVSDNGSSLTVDNATISVVGGGTEATAQRVTIANDSTGVLSVDDNGGSLTVDGTVSISGTVTTTGGLTDTQLRATPVPVSGTVTITDGSGAVTVDGTVAATQSGTWNVGTVTTVTNVVHVDDNAGTLSIDDGGGNISIDDGGNSITVDYATTGSGTATGALRVELPTNGTGVIATVGAVTSLTNALPAGTNAIGKLAANSGVDIGDVDVTSITPGTGATNLGKAEDAAHTSGDTGVMALAVRNDAGTAFAADGDYVPLSVDSSGAVRVTGGGGGTQYTEGDVDATVTGTAILWEDTSDTLRSVSAAKPLPVNIISGAGSGGTAMTDDAAFTVGTTSVTPAAGTYRSVRDAVDDNDAGALAMTSKRGLYVSVETPNGDSAMDDTLDSVKVTNATAANLNATVVGTGTFAVQATVAAGATNIAKAEDVASADGDVGVPALAVRKATPANTSGTDGDYEFIQMSAGRVWTSATIDAALPTGANVIGALSANQSVNQAQVAGTTVDTNSGNKSAGTQRIVIATDQPNLTTPLNQNTAQMNGVAVTMNNGVSGTGVQRVTIASDSTGQVALAGTPATTLAGVAEDAALSGNALRQGLRAHSGVPTAMSADNDIVTPWADRSGAQAVIPQPRQVDIQGIPTLGTSTDYTSGDFMGTVITFTGVALASGRPIQVVGARVLDRAIQSVALTLLLFRASPTVASADNAALSITAANASTAVFLGKIVFAAADYVGATSCSMCAGTVNGGQSSIPIVTSGSANIFGVLVAGGTYNAAAAGDIEINLVCNQF